MQKSLKIIFFLLVCLSVTAAFWVFKDLLFPFVTSKAFFFRIAVELALPLYLYFLVSDSRLRPNLKNPLHLAMLAFCVLNFLSAFFGVNLTRSLWGNFERMGGAYYTAHLVALYFYIVALGQMGGPYLQWFLKVALWVGILVAGSGISGWLGGPTLVIDPSLPGRVSSTLGNPIYLGSFLIIPFFFSLFFAKQTNSALAKAGYYFLSGLCLGGLYLSGTRGALMGLLLGSFIGALLYLFFTTNKKIKIYGFVAVGLCAVAAVVLFNLSDKFPEGSTARRIFKLNDSNTQSRLLQWQVALIGFKDRPLLGTGPENYYVVANQYYNPQIAKYDASWFDKPHNYLLEILITQGLIGFLAYSCILIFFAAALYKGFKAGLYSLLEFCFLFASLAAYQIQNLFVFDTVPTSLMFFSFAGFAGYIWDISKTDPTGKTLRVMPTTKAFSAAVFGVSLIVVMYALYATNIVPMKISKSINYGYAYSGVDLNKALEYFKTAITLPFNFDSPETASKFADFAASAVRSGREQDKSVALKALNESTQYLRQVTQNQGNSPILWQRLAMAHLFTSTQVGDKIIVNPLAQEAINKAIALAPNRNEANLTLAQMRGFEGNFVGAEKILRKALENIPTDKNVKFQLINLYKNQNRLDLAAPLMEELLTQNYNFSSYADVKWLIDYYVQKKNFAKAVLFLQKMTEQDPKNLQVFVDLAKLYALAGKYSEARNLAEQIIKFDVSKEKEMRELIDSLPN